MYELKHFEDLSDEQQKKVAAVLCWDDAMEAGVTGTIRAKFPEIWAKMWKEEFGTDATITAKASGGNYPPELFMWWDDLQQGNKLAELRKRDYTAYAVVFEDTFGKLPDLDDKSLARTMIDFTLMADYKNARHAWLVEELKKMSWDELLEKNYTNLLRKEAPDVYKEKYHEEYGSYPIMN